MKTVNYRGRELPINFGIRTFNEACKLMNISFGEAIAADETPKANTLELLVLVTLFALNDGARKAGKERRYTEDDVWDMFEDEPQLVNECSELFAESIAVNAENISGGGKEEKEAIPKRKGKAT